jgi:hypothetical protein
VVSTKLRRIRTSILTRQSSSWRMARISKKRHFPLKDKGRNKILNPPRRQFIKDRSQNQRGSKEAIQLYLTIGLIAYLKTLR